MYSYNAKCSRIPFKDPSGESVILPSADFKRITSESRVLTKEERAALKEAHQKKKDEEIVGKHKKQHLNIP